MADLGIIEVSAGEAPESDEDYDEELNELESATLAVEAVAATEVTFVAPVEQPKKVESRLTPVLEPISDSIRSSYDGH